MICAHCNNRVRTNGDPQWLQGGHCEACGELLCGRCLDEADEYGRCEQCQKEENLTQEMEYENSEK